MSARYRVTTRQKSKTPLYVPYYPCRHRHSSLRQTVVAVQYSTVVYICSNLLYIPTAASLLIARGCPAVARVGPATPTQAGRFRLPFAILAGPEGAFPPPLPLASATGATAIVERSQNNTVCSLYERRHGTVRTTHEF